MVVDHAAFGSAQSGPWSSVLVGHEASGLFPSPMGATEGWLGRRVSLLIAATGGLVGVLVAVHQGARADRYGAAPRRCWWRPAPGIVPDGTPKSRPPGWLAERQACLGLKRLVLGPRRRSNTSAGGAAQHVMNISARRLLLASSPLSVPDASA